MRLLFALFFPISLLAQTPSNSELARWQQRSRQVTIIRDQWGIPHVYGQTDADAVFGLMYAQCEDDFNRVEMNYIEKLGRKAELLGEEELYNDLYIRLVIDSAGAVADYRKAPAWLQQLLQAWADGIHYYLYKHPEVKPALLTNFQPWYPLLWTDGSIGAINTGDVTGQDVQDFYSSNQVLSVRPGSTDNALALLHKQEQKDAAGSNGFALAPARSASGNALLYINPHTTFYFRPEVQMVSGEGLHAYGAVTWGQFFVYQGFNEYCGWMHTSNNVDVSDLYRLTLRRNGNGYQYLFEGKWKPVQQVPVTLRYTTENGMRSKTIITYRTHHGPVMARRNGACIAVRHNNRDMKGLIQSWLRTKAKGLEDYKQVMALTANASNNTVFADRDGNIAYWHGNFVPRRNPSFNWSQVMDGSTAAAEWKGVHRWDENIYVINPATGWIQNCNSTPFTVSGSASPKAANYPRYMAPDGENFRGINASRLLASANHVTLDSLITLGYNRKLAAFEVLIPALLKAYEAVPTSDSLHTRLQAPIAVLRSWNYDVATTSVATTLAVEWAQLLGRSISKVYVDEGEDDQVTKTKQFAATATPVQLLHPLLKTVEELQRRFGRWDVAWGDVNRFQRISGAIQQRFDDAQPSYPVAFASGTWGMLPAYNSRSFTGTSKRYGFGGNSFVCAVELGPRIRAKSVLAGGVSGNPQSQHFNDQSLMYTNGQFKEVLFYREDVERHAVRSYRPGEGGGK